MTNVSSGSTPFQQSVRKFRSNTLAVLGLLFILFVSLISALGPFVRPDQSVNANGQSLMISRQKPLFDCEVFLQPLGRSIEKPSIFEAWAQGGYPSPFREIPIENYRWENDALILTLFGSQEEERFSCSQLLPNSECNEANRSAFISEHIQHKYYWLGTDKYGRDVLSRLMAGASISLMVGVIAVLISLIIGIGLGAVAGYYGGAVDKLIMWFINVIWSIPTLLLVIAITFAFGKGFWKVFIAVGLTMWVEVARVVRGQFLSLREKEYVEAGKVLGFSSGRIIFRHMLPNAMGPVIVIAAANFAAAILIEAGLSFLGIGAQIPVPSWGNMIKENYNLITTDLAYLAFTPGICIMLLVLSFMLVGNGLRDALDVKG